MPSKILQRLKTPGFLFLATSKWTAWVSPLTRLSALHLVSLKRKSHLFLGPVCPCSLFEAHTFFCILKPYFLQRTFETWRKAAFYLQGDFCLSFFKTMASFCKGLKTCQCSAVRPWCREALAIFSWICHDLEKTLMCIVLSNCGFSTLLLLQLIIRCKTCRDVCLRESIWPRFSRCVCMFMCFLLLIICC